MMLVLINMVLSVKHHQDSWKIMDELIKQILMGGFSSTLDIGWVEDLQMMKDKLIDGKRLQVCLKVN